MYIYIHTYRISSILKWSNQELDVKESMAVLPLFKKGHGLELGYLVAVSSELFLCTLSTKQ